MTSTPYNEENVIITHLTSTWDLRIGNCGIKDLPFFTLFAKLFAGPSMLETIFPCKGVFYFVLNANIQFVLTKHKRHDRFYTTNSGHLYTLALILYHKLC